MYCASLSNGKQNVACVSHGKMVGMQYIIKNNKSLNEWTQGHPKTKPKSKLMHAKWEQGKVLNWDGHGGFN
jgi:hypothetical protein